MPNTAANADRRMVSSKVRDEGGHAEERLAGDLDRIIDGARPPLEQQAAGAAGERTYEHDPGHLGAGHAEHPVKPVHRERRVRVELYVPLGAHLLGRVKEIPRRGELGHHSEDLRRGSGTLGVVGAHRAPPSCLTPAGWWCGSACGITFLSSAIAIMGRKRRKSRKQVKKRPKVPTNVPTSTQVGL
jgi:hypothetical protein